MKPEHYDVLIVGAGLAGIGFAYHLQTKCKKKSFAIFEARDRLGGTWDLFRYPGVRSDVNMHLYGYEFEPWTKGACIAPGEDILQYLDHTASKHGLKDKMQFNWRMISADWSNDDGRWNVLFESDGGEKSRRVTTDWLQICTGYFSYKSGHSISFENEEAFQGPILHPQEWPEDEALIDKNVVIIGSGATAVTLAPSLSKSAKHVAVVQRSPGYVFSADSRDYLGERLERWLPNKISFPLIRRRNLLLDQLRWWLTTRKPEIMISKIEEGRDRWLPADFDYDTHFKPNYLPSEQRVCFSPDGDYFQAIGAGDVSVHTDTVKRLLPQGVELSSGEVIAADAIVTATGLNMVLAGEATLSVDGEPVVYADKMMYRGNMFSDVPNCSFTIGTFVAPYTLRVEMIAKWVCNLLDKMDRGNYHVAIAKEDARQKIVSRDFADDFTSGYIRRVSSSFPKQGTETPWRNVQSYGDNRKMLCGRVQDKSLILK